MQVVENFGTTAADLGRELKVAAETTFFDSVEVDGTTVICKKNGTAVFSILYYQNTVYYNWPDGTNNVCKRAVISTDFVYKIAYSDNAVYLTTAQSAGSCVIIAKDTAGDLVFITNISQNMVAPFVSGANNIVVYRENGDTFSRMYYLNDDATNKKSFFVPLLVDDDLFVDDVYVGLIRPFPENTENIEFTIGSIGYVGFGGTSLIVKTT